MPSVVLPKIKSLSSVIAITFFWSANSFADDYFNLKALELGPTEGTTLDSNMFSVSGKQAPGTYRVDVYVNNERRFTRDFNFVQSANGELAPELNINELNEMGINVDAIPSFTGVDSEYHIKELATFIPDAKVVFDFSRQKLSISIPQIYISNAARGSISPELLDDGLAGLFVSYNFNGTNSRTDSESNEQSDSYFNNLRSGLNIGPWRIRNYSTWNYHKNNSGTTNKWDSISTYIQRDITTLKSQLTLGDTFTPSDVFESIQFLGAKLASDDNMLPDSQRGFAPIIRGIANSNAKITIKQDNSVIYQTNVPPGAFIIDDLFPTASSGDLQVLITEADGSERTFIQPFSSVPIMQRLGRLKYSAIAGEYRSNDNEAIESEFGQFTLQYGLLNNLTIYGGMQLSKNYSAFTGGSGIGLGDFGSFSADITQANTSLQDNHETGQQYRFQYSKDIATTSSTITLAGYHYSTKGFNTFSEAMKHKWMESTNSYPINDNKRSKMQLDLAQNLNEGKWGSLLLSGYQQDYWNRDDYERGINFSYQNSFGGINYSLMYSYSKMSADNDSNDQQIALSVSVPLSPWLHKSYATYNVSHDSQGHTYTQVGINGTALEDNNLSYSIAEGYGNHGVGNSGSVSADYRGTYGRANIGYNYNPDTHQINYGLQGTILTHSQGVTLGQPISGDNSSFVLVRAPSASNIKINNGVGIYTDAKGYAIVPYVSSYRRTRISVDPSTLPDDVEMPENVQSVVPNNGAIVAADFNPKKGYRALVELTKDGKSIPFGAVVLIDNSESNTGIVDENGIVYLSGLSDEGVLNVKWGSLASQKCEAKFALPQVNKSLSLHKLTAVCK